MRRNNQNSPINATGIVPGIGITASSFPVNPKNLNAGIKNLTDLGFPVQVDDLAFGRKGLFSASDDNRAKSLHRLAKDPSIDAIFCARGGYGVTRILPLLDRLGTAVALRKNPKILFGFSDATALHFYVHQKTALPSVHSPMPGTALWQKQWSRTKKILLPLLAGKMGIEKKSHTLEWKTKSLLPARNELEGVVVGGNLTLLVQLIGTPWQPDLRGKILFLEDCGERPYRVDRMLVHLRNSGMLDGVKAVLLGDFMADVVYSEAGEKKFWKSVLTETFEELNIPVVGGLPVGHGARNELLPLGVRYLLGKNGKLQILDQVI